MISLIHVREINEQNGIGSTSVCTVASLDEMTVIDMGSYRTWGIHFRILL